MLKEVSWCRVVCLLFLVGRGMLIYSGKNKCIYLEGWGNNKALIHTQLSQLDLLLKPLLLQLSWTPAHSWDSRT